MKKSELLISGDKIIRVLSKEADKIFIIDCIKRTMPQWVTADSLSVYSACEYNTLLSLTDMEVFDIESLDCESKRFMRFPNAWIACLGIWQSGKNIWSRSERKRGSPCWTTFTESNQSWRKGDVQSRRNLFEGTDVRQAVCIFPFGNGCGCHMHLLGQRLLCHTFF